jgi:hypothetical protein
MERMRVKTVHDIDVLLSRQLTKLDGPKVTPHDLKVANSISNMVGKWLKANTIKMQYLDHRFRGGRIIKTLESSRA